MGIDFMQSPRLLFVRRVHQNQRRHILRESCRKPASIDTRDRMPNQQEGRLLAGRVEQGVQIRPLAMAIPFRVHVVRPLHRTGNVLAERFIDALRHSARELEKRMR